MHRVERVFGQPRPDAPERAVIHDRREHHTVDGDLLDAMEQGFTLAGISLAGLLLAILSPA